MFWQDTSRFLKSMDETKRPTNDSMESSMVAWLDPTDDPASLGRWAGYEVTALIGQGGMGVVCKARDVSLDRFVAIKILQPNYAGQSASRQRFAREAQAAAGVVHDNVIAIYGVDQWNGLPFLVMPYIKGQSLQQRINEEAPLLVEDILRVGIQVSRGLAAAHHQGLIHRDVKPANVLLPVGVSRVILTDFGLARAADDASLTSSGVLAGTPQYMSPEQARGDLLDARSDLFSLGSLLYCMACGHPPFRAETAYGVLRKVTEAAHQPVIEIRHDVPQWLSAAMDRLLAKKPSDRFESAKHVAEYLQDCLAHLQQPTTTQLPTLQTVSQKRSLPFRIGWIVFASYLAGVMLLATWWNFAPTTSDVSRRDPVSTDTDDWIFNDSTLSELERELDSLHSDLDLHGSDQ